MPEEVGPGGGKECDHTTTRPTRTGVACGGRRLSRYFYPLGCEARHSNGFRRGLRRRWPLPSRRWPTPLRARPSWRPAARVSQVHKHGHSINDQQEPALIPKHSTRRIVDHNWWRVVTGQAELSIAATMDVRGL